MKQSTHAKKELICVVQTPSVFTRDQGCINASVNVDSAAMEKYAARSTHAWRTMVAVITGLRKLGKVFIFFFFCNNFCKL